MEGEAFQRLTEHQFPLELEVLLLSLAQVKQWEVRNLLLGPTDKKGNFINISKDDSSYVETLQYLLLLSKVKQWEVRNLLLGPTDKKGTL